MTATTNSESALLYAGLVLVVLAYAWPAVFLLRGAGGAWMLRVANRVDGISAATGRIIAWASLGLVLLQFVIVILRYVFGIGFIFLQEGVLYLHATLFLVAASYTLFVDGHVRVDMFYRTARPRIRAAVDFAGSYLFLLPVTLAVFILSYPYVRASWQVLESSRETSGIPAVFLLKTAIPVFAALVLMQGFALAARAALRLRGVDADSPHHRPAV